MQELEKILEEIDNLYVDETDFGIECNMENRSDVACDNCYECIKEACKNIIRKHMNDGWIPVEEEQPEEDGFYMATMDGEIVGQEEPFVGLAEFENGKWIDDEEDYKCVIAWRPLPEPYRPERSDNHDGE